MKESNLSAVMAKRRKIPVKTAEKWADVLRLSLDEREVFLDAVHLAAASPRVRAMVRRLEARLRKRKPK
jgi:hypothetical protein